MCNSLCFLQMVYININDWSSWRANLKREKSYTKIVWQFCLSEDILLTFLLKNMDKFSFCFHPWDALRSQVPHILVGPLTLNAPRLQTVELVLQELTGLHVSCLDALLSRRSKKFVKTTQFWDAEVFWERQQNKDECRTSSCYVLRSSKMKTMKTKNDA